MSTDQRWHRIWHVGVDSGSILRFSFGPGSEPGVKNLRKNGSGVTFQFENLLDPDSKILEQEQSQSQSLKK